MHRAESLKARMFSHSPWDDASLAQKGLSAAREAINKCQTSPGHT